MIHLEHGRQATAVVLLYGDRRDLVVDGDLEASPVGDARAPEELLAILPLMLHAHPKRFLEIGLGSGTTFGTATRFPLEELECVEIAQSVLDAAPYFAPDNQNVTTVRDERLTILRGDGRAHLLRRSGYFDVVVANTLHPWSLGATGLYSREYFERLSGALRQGGIATQWLPLGTMGKEHLAAILRSFYDVFDHGALFWGAGNVMLVGSDRPIETLESDRFEMLAAYVDDALERIGVDSAGALEQRRIADLAAIEKILGQGQMLSDDRPVLEARTFLRDPIAARMGEDDLLVRIARAGHVADARREAVLLWLESRAARALGERERADQLELLAEQAHFLPARRARLQRAYAKVRDSINAGNVDDAMARLEEITEEAPEFSDAWLSIARIKQRQEHVAQGQAALERVVALDPMRGEAWTLLGLSRWKQQDLTGARDAFVKAVSAAPYLPEALLAAGGFAISQNDPSTAERMLDRLDAVSVYGSRREAESLRERLEARR